MKHFTGLLLSLALPFMAAASAQIDRADLSSVKSYLSSKTELLVGKTTKLEALGDRYYALAERANFDYAALQQGHAAEVAVILAEARETWTAASPLYEQVEGIVAGTPSLAQFDVDLDAGASAERTRRTPFHSISRSLTGAFWKNRAICSASPRVRSGVHSSVFQAG